MKSQEDSVIMGDSTPIGNGDWINMYHGAM